MQLVFSEGLYIVISDSLFKISRFSFSIVMQTQYPRNNFTTLEYSYRGERESQE